MRITLSFSSLKDFGELFFGLKLRDILQSYGFEMEKIGECEPIKTDYSEHEFQRLWNQDRTLCSVLFKGRKKHRFLGMAGWSAKKFRNDGTINGVNVWLTIPPKYDYSELIRIGDELFLQTEALHGYISENSKDYTKTFIQKNGCQVSMGNIYKGIPCLMWVNYFGRPYMSENGLRFPDNQTLLGHGTRVKMTDAPTDERLSDMTFINDSIMEMGADWFFLFDTVENGVGVPAEEMNMKRRRIPDFGSF